MEAAEAIAAAVDATNQTYVDALKGAGKFDVEAQKQAAQKALAACLQSISPAAQRFIESPYGDIREYLTNRIEAEVRKQRWRCPCRCSVSWPAPWRKRKSRPIRSRKSPGGGSFAGLLPGDFAGPP